MTINYLHLYKGLKAPRYGQHTILHLRTPYTFTDLSVRVSFIGPPLAREPPCSKRDLHQPYSPGKNNHLIKNNDISS